MYRDRWAKPAQRALKGLTSEQKTRVLAAVDEVCADPVRAPGVKPLSGNLKGKYRKRVGDLRVIYSFDSMKQELYVLTVDWRGNVY